MQSLRHKLFGNRAFYKMVLLVAVPIMVQNGITNFVNLLDNIMVGQIGTESMSGVAIVNQLIFIYNLCIFGGLSGAGIFTAQYYGKEDQEGIRHTFRYKLGLGILLTALAVAVFLIGGDALIQSYLQGSNDGSDPTAALRYGKEYLWIMLAGLPAFALLQVYSSTLRECGETVVPMRAGIIAILVNLTFNYLLIYGKFGFPQLGVAGAAIATVLARYVEMIIVVRWTHKNVDRNPYVIGLYRTIKVPLHLAKVYFLKGSPLLVNETLWAAGVAVLLQCYSVRGLNVVAGMNISNTIQNLFNIAFIAMGDAVAIIVGQLLGANKMKEARETDTKIIVFSVLCCLVTSTLMFFIAPLFPQLYQTSAQSQEYAKTFIIITAIFMPQNAFLHAAYFTLRSGGQTVITFLFDSVFLWCVSVPLAFCLSRFTTLPVMWILIAVNIADWLKCIMGFVLVRKGVWMKNIAISSSETVTE
jgi:putative MATE family efflux protein